MNEGDDEVLERIARSITDGQPWEWPAEAADRPELARSLRGLQRLAAVGRLHESARIELSASQVVALAQASTEERAEVLEQVAPVFTWGMLRALERLGQGSFGEVWRAYDPSLHREVALKLRRLPEGQRGLADLAGTSDPRARQWLREARRLASVRHPHVLTVHGAAIHDGREGMWTELVRGETLEQRLDRTGPLPAREAASIGIDLCGALAAVHAAGLVHGDVKPANVMIEPAGSDGARPRVVLMDFGAAHEIAPRARAATITTGTPLLMAPELLEGGEPTVASDVYAAGVVLYRLASGRWPVEATSIEELRERHAAGRRTPLAEARPGLPAAFVRAVERALAHRPADRHPDTLVLRRALLPVGAPGRTLRTRLAFAGAVLVAGLALGAAYWFSQRAAVDHYVPVEAMIPATRGDLLREGPPLTGSVPEAFFGARVAEAGDVNGDGFDDVVIGSPDFTGDRLEQGRVELFLGSPHGLAPRPAWEARGVDTGEHLGDHVRLVGDLDGDGRRDLLVNSVLVLSPEGAPVRALKAYRAVGAAFDTLPFRILYGPQAGAWYGSDFVDPGDVNGDGFGDLLIGCSTCLERHEAEGRVELFLGSPKGIGERPAWIRYGGMPGVRLGWRLARTGDLDGDGYDDLLFGMAHWNGRQPRQGRALLYRGGPHGPGPEPSGWVDGTQPGGGLGWNVGGGGDVDGDGHPDLLIHEHSYSGRGVAEGRVLLFSGADTTLRPRREWKGFGANARIGFTLLTLQGDFDGDGRSDVAFASSTYLRSDESGSIGIAEVALSGGRRPFDLVWRSTGQDPNHLFAYRGEVADVNGDGRDDLLIAEPGWRSGAGQVGRVRVFFGQPRAAGATPGR
jgi:hypothetical protein